MKFFLKQEGETFICPRDFPEFIFVIKSQASPLRFLKREFQTHIKTLLGKGQIIPLPRSMQGAKWKSVIVDREISSKILISYITEVHNDIVSVNYWHEFRFQYHIILNQSPVKRFTSSFWHFVKMSFSYELVRRISTLVEGQNKNHDPIVSLRALLEMCLEYPSLLSKNLYMGCHPNNFKNFAKKEKYSEMSEFFKKDLYLRLNKEFDEMAGRRCNRIPKRIIRRDIERLENATKSLVKFRHKVLAHNDLRKSDPVPKLNEIPRALQIIHDLGQKYYLLITCSHSTQQLPLQSIESIFSESWIATSQAGQQIREKFKKLHSNPFDFKF